jgi:O-antigen ligase
MLPISVSISETLSVIGFVILLTEFTVFDRRAETWGLWRVSPVVWACLGFFLLLGLGTLYSSAPLPEAWRAWFKYRELLYLPLFLLLCRDHRAAAAGLLGYFVAMGAIVILGSTRLYHPIYLLVRPFDHHLAWGNVFGSYIAEGLFLAIVIHFLAVAAILDRKHRLIFAILAVICIGYVFFLTAGRTGYVVVAVLAALLVVQAAPRRLMLPGFLAIAIAVAGLYFASPLVQQRVGGVGEALQGEHADFSAASAGARMQYIKLGLQAFWHHPILGTGTGSFGETYAELAAAEGYPPSRNPHNQYLLTGVEMGGIGVLGLLALFAVLWRESLSLPRADRWRGQAVLLAFMVACLFNSMLLDHKEGHSFAFLVALMFSGAYRREDQHRHHDL